MKTLFKYCCILLSIWVLIVACEEDPIPEPTGVIPESVRPYVDRFLWEAQRRGLNPDISRLSIQFERNINIPLGDDQKTVVGSCTRLRDRHLVKLDTLNSLWLLSGYLGREEIVFHELGHCLLDRPHRDDTFVSGYYASIMRAVGLLQYGDLNNYTSLFTNPTGLKSHRRDYYIDELFDQSIAAPCWADSNALPNYPVAEFEQDFISSRKYNRSWIDPWDHLWFFGRERNYRYMPGQGFDDPLPGITISSMSNTKDNLLWIAGADVSGNLIGTFDRGKLKVHYRPQDLPEDLLTIDRVLVDGLQRVWISDRGGKLYLNSGQGFQKVQLPSKVRISGMRLAPNNKVYILKEGLLYIVENENTIRHLGKENSDLPTSFFRRVEIDGNGIAWLQPAGSARYLVRMTPDFEVSRVYHNNINLTEIRINDITCDPMGNIWAATSNGLRKWEQQQFSKYCDYNTGLKVLNFSSILVGSNEVIWAIGKDRHSGQTKLLRLQPDA